MTIAVYPNGQRATVSVDTYATLDDKVFNMTKLFPVAHLHAVVLGCGLMSLLSVVSGYASASQSLDDLCNGIPGVVQHMREELAKAPDVPPGVLEQAAETVVAVVAYAGDRVRARVWNGYADPAYAVHDVTTAYFAPHSVELRGIVPLTLQEHERVAREQVARWRPRAKERGMLLGGKLLYASVDEVGISVRELCDLEAPDAKAVEMPNRPIGPFAAARSAVMVG
jgi:hypothetical protein